MRPTPRALVASVGLLLAGACGTTVSQVDLRAPAGTRPAVEAGIGGQEGVGAPAPRQGRLQGPSPTRTSTQVGAGPASAATSSGTTAVLGPRQTGPLEVGFFIWDNSQVATALGLGSNTITTPTVERSAAKAYIDDLNAKGGVAGRRLVPVFASVSATSSDYQSDYQAACQSLTRDHHVAVVISDGLSYGQSFNACLAKAGVAQLVLSGAGYSSGIGDAVDLKSNPGLIGVNTVTADRRLESVMGKAIATGSLHKGSKLGVFVEDCSYDERAYAQVLAPLARQHGIELTRVDSQCVAAGLPQAGQQISLDQSAVLRFRSAGVDSVLFDSALEFDLFFYFSEQASSQHWTPQYLLFDSFGASAASGAVPSDQVPGMRGFGGWPLIDVSNPPAPPAAQAAVRKTCLSTAARAGVKPQSLQDRMTVLDMCDGVRLLHAALAGAQGLVSVPRVVAAVEQLGESFVSSIDLGGTTRFGAARHDGQELTAVSRYEARCTCFAYITAPSAVG